MRDPAISAAPVHGSAIERLVRFARTPTRYGITAAFCLLLHNLIMIGADRLGLTMIEAALVSFVVLAIVGYALLSRWAFASPRTWAGFWRYTGVMAASFPISITLLWIFFRLAGQPMAIAAPLASLSMALINFCSSRWAIAGWPLGRPNRPEAGS